MTAKAWVSQVATATRPTAELDGDLAATRVRICQALRQVSGLGVVCRRRHGLWSLATRSVDDATAWPVCETLSHVQVAISDRIQTCILGKGGEEIAALPKGAVAASLLRQLDPLPDLDLVEHVTSWPIWADGRWQGSREGEYDKDSRTICALDDRGAQALEHLREGQRIAELAADRVDGLRRLAEQQLAELSRVCEGADWLAPCDFGSWITTVVAAATRLQWASPSGSPSPMLLVRSPQIGAGGGKSTLAHCVGLIAGASASLSTEGVDPGEIQRQLGPILGDRVPVVVCDEIGSLRQNGVVDTYWHEILTSKSISVRVIGTSTRATTENHTIFVATGIDPTYRGQTRRRVIAARLAGPARPNGAKAREGKTPRAYCLAHAARLWSAASLIVWAYRQAGCPELDCLDARPSYEDYDLARRAVIWAGAPDCYDRSEDEDLDDADLVAGAQLLEQIREAMTETKRSAIAYRDLAVYVGCKPTDRGAASRLSTEIRRSAWPAGWRVVQRKPRGTAHYYVQQWDEGGSAWVDWSPGDRPLSVVEATPEPATIDLVTRDHEVRISIGAGRPDHSTSDPSRVAITLANLAENLARPVETKGGYYLAPGYRTDTEERETYPRRELELEQADIVGLDYDAATPEQVSALLEALGEAGLAHLVATTYSHTPEAPRIRLLLPLARPVDPPTYRATWNAISVWVETETGMSADPAPSHIASVLYLGQQPGSEVGAHPAEADRWVLWQDGRTTRPIEPEAARPKPKLAATEPRPHVAPADRAARVAAYLDRVPTTSSTPELYQLVCRVGDLASDEAQVREHVTRWARRADPHHSTGEVFSEREIDKLIGYAIKYRQNTIGGAA